MWKDLRDIWDGRKFSLLLGGWNDWNCIARLMSRICGLIGSLISNCCHGDLAVESNCRCSTRTHIVHPLALTSLKLEFLCGCVWVYWIEITSLFITENFTVYSTHAERPFASTFRALGDKELLQSIVAPDFFIQSPASSPEQEQWRNPSCYYRILRAIRKLFQL